MRTLLLVQFALSLLLVTAAGLLLRTSVGLSGVTLGFDSGHVVLLEVADETPGDGSFNAIETAETKARRAATYRLAEELVRDPRSPIGELVVYGLFSPNDLWTPLIDPLGPRIGGRLASTSFQRVISRQSGCASCGDARSPRAMGSRHHGLPS